MDTPTDLPFVWQLEPAALAAQAVAVYAHTTYAQNVGAVFLSRRADRRWRREKAQYDAERYAR